MKNLFSVIILILALAMPIVAQDNWELSNKILNNVKVQGTITGDKIVPSAIIDDKIAREGDIFLIDESTGNIVLQLFEKELGDHPDHLKVKVVAIAHGNVVLAHVGTNLSLIATR